MCHLCPTVSSQQQRDSVSGKICMYVCKAVMRTKNRMHGRVSTLTNIQLYYVIFISQKKSIILAIY